MLLFVLLSYFIFQFTNSVFRSNLLAHLLERGHLFTAVDEIRGERQRQGAVAHHSDTGNLVAHPAQRTLLFPEQRQDARSGCARRTAGIGVTEKSRALAHTPN